MWWVLRVILYPVSHANFTPLKFVQHRPRTTGASPATESGHDIIVRALTRTALRASHKIGGAPTICAYARGGNGPPKLGTTSESADCMVV
jgi:hypothetical protein